MLPPESPDTHAHARWRRQSLVASRRMRTKHPSMQPTMAPATPPLGTTRDPRAGNRAITQASTMARHKGDSSPPTTRRHRSFANEGTVAMTRHPTSATLSGLRDSDPATFLPLQGRSSCVPWWRTPHAFSHRAEATTMSCHRAAVARCRSRATSNMENDGARAAHPFKRSRGEKRTHCASNRAPT